MSASLLHYPIRDSYTGAFWCASGEHLLLDANVDPHGRCRPCQARNARERRGRARQLQEAAA